MPSGQRRAKDPFVLTWHRHKSTTLDSSFLMSATTLPNGDYMGFTISREGYGDYLLITVDGTEFRFDTMDSAKRFAAGFMALLKLVKGMQ